MNNQRLGILYAILASVAYSIFPAFTKLSYQHGASQSLLIIGSTFLRAISLIVSAVLLKNNLNLLLVYDRNIIFTGLLQVLSVAGIMLSLEYLPASVMIIIIFIYPTLLLLYQSYKKEMILSVTSALCSLGALFGLTLVVNLYSKFENISVLGVMIAFLSAIITASRMYVYGKQVVNISPSIVGARAFIIASILSLLYLFYQEITVPQDLIGKLYVLLACISLAFGAVLTFHALKYLGSFKLGLLTKIEPIFSSLIAYFAISEVLSFSQYVGMAIVVFCIGYCHWYEMRGKKLV